MVRDSSQSHSIGLTTSTLSPPSVFLAFAKSQIISSAQGHFSWVYRAVGFPGGSMEKHLPAKIYLEIPSKLMMSLLSSWRRKWQPTPVFLPGESQGWRSLVGCRCLWGCTELDTTEAT